MSLPTSHFRFATDGRLQQLFVFDDDDQWMLSRHALTDVDAEVFREEPNHTVAEWLTRQVMHEWRNVPIEKAPQ